MAFRAMDAGCGGPDGCDGVVTVVGLYVAGSGTVWRSFACAEHADHLLAPRALRARDRDLLRRRADLAADPRIGRRYAGERDGPVARGPAAEALVRRALEWAERHPLA